MLCSVSRGALHGGIRRKFVQEVQKQHGATELGVAVLQVRVARSC